MSTWSFEELRALQNRKLRAFLRQQIYPFSPYYRELFDDNAIDVKSIKTTDDLVRIPFTSKKDIAPDDEDPRRHVQFILTPTEDAIIKYAPKRKLLKLANLKMTQGDKAVRELLEQEYAPIFIIFTTGRTARPTPFLFTKYDFSIWDVHTSRMSEISKEQIDFESGMACLNALPYAPHGGFWQAYRSTTLQGILTLHTGGGKIMGTEKILDALASGTFTSLTATPGYLYHLLRKAKEEGRNLSSLKHITSGAERAHPDYRQKLLQLARDCGALDPKFSAAGGFTEQKHYPLECIGGEDSGYHTWPDLDFFEIVDPDTGQRLPDSASGELTYTALDGRGSIVIRYRTGI